VTQQGALAAPRRGEEHAGRRQMPVEDRGHGLGQGVAGPLLLLARVLVTRTDADLHLQGGEMLVYLQVLGAAPARDSGELPGEKG
jgi:hypothetical protein